MGDMWREAKGLGDFRSAGELGMGIGEAQEDRARHIIRYDSILFT